jgi:Arc/MetJ family transcription regulator
VTKRSIDIDAELLSKAMRLSGGKTKSEVVHAAMELLVRIMKQEQARRRRGAGVFKLRLKD